MEALLVVIVVSAVLGYAGWGRAQSKRTAQSKLDTFRKAMGRHVWIGVLGFGGHAQVIDEWHCEVLDVTESASPPSVHVRLIDGTERYAPLANIRWVRLSSDEEQIRW